ncbi:major facilitator superfamily domain-containing protein [Amylostereum chailletii]|nr:major facilitator superfamily domain-containing protein [Amylostereum chailletii]
MVATASPSRASTVIQDVRSFNEERKDDRQKQEVTLDEKSEAFLVTWDEGDPENPLNWSRTKRWYMTIVGGILVLNATFASSAPSNMLPPMIEYFGFSLEVATLMISLFVAGYCVGPLIWAPASEQMGRRPVFLFTFFCYTGFQVGCALSKNTASILIFRLLGGIFAAAPLTNSGGLVSDIWDVKTRGTAMVLFALAPFAGPALGPVCSGWMSIAGVSWRWLFWVLTIFAGSCFCLIFCTLPETYVPVLLVKKAKRLRAETGDARYYAPMELGQTTLSQTINKTLATPFKVLFQEPVLMAITFYMSFLYGVIYLIFEAFPIVFTEGHHLNAGISGLMFLPISIGGACGGILYLVYYNPRYVKLMKVHAPAKVPPEARLEPCLLAAPLFAVAFFWFGWTSFPSISYWSPLLAGGLLGFAIFMIFFSLINYVVDMYLFVAASALAATTVVRSIFGAVFPLFARQMFDAMNPRWASTLLGCVALVMVPIPIILVKFGPTLRTKSRFAPHIPLTPSPAMAEA